MKRIDTDEMKILIKESKENNFENFEFFYELTKRQIYVSIMLIIKNKETTEDIMQETYMRFLQNIHKYKENTNVIAFIVTIARNLAINQYNKNKREINYDFSQYYEEKTSFKDTPLMELVYETLEKDELEVFILHIIDELKHREIAKIMKKPIGTITWLYNKAVKKLKKKLGDLNE